MRYLLLPLLIMAVPFRVLGMESAAHRENLAVYVAGELVGFTTTPVSGGRLGLLFGKNTAGELSYATGSFDFLDKEVQKKVIEAKLKTFLGNSFYADIGAAMEQWVIHDKDSFILSTNANPRKITVEDSGFVAHLGNQWQWTNFTLGCDWIGYFIAMKKSVDVISDKELTVDQLRSEERNAETRYASNGAHFLRFYVGLAF